jgi:hypothetical protein
MPNSPRKAAAARPPGAYSTGQGTGHPSGRSCQPALSKLSASRPGSTRSTCPSPLRPEGTKRAGDLFQRTAGEYAMAELRGGRCGLLTPVGKLRDSIMSGQSIQCQVIHHKPVIVLGNYPARSLPVTCRPSHEGCSKVAASSGDVGQGKGSVPVTACSSLLRIGFDPADSLFVEVVAWKAGGSHLPRQLPPPDALCIRTQGRFLIYVMDARQAYGRRRSAAGSSIPTRRSRWR